MNQTHLQHVAIEGVIGAGKTSLAEILSERWNARFIRETHEENPFLARFYADPRSSAFQAQIFFLVSRFKQQREICQPDLFQSRTVTDYLFDKDRIFAGLTLDEEELAIYENLFEELRPRAPRPDLVVFLRVSAERAVENIRLRDREYERAIDPEYIERLVDAYHHFFYNYTEAPVLRVEADAVDFVRSAAQREELIARIESAARGGGVR